MATMSKSDRLRQVINRFDANVLRVFQNATSLCVSRGNYEIAPEHLLARLLDETTGDVPVIFSAFHVDRTPVRRAVNHALNKMPGGHGGRPAVSAKLVDLVESAAVLADEYQFEQIRTGCLVFAFVLNPHLLESPEAGAELERIDSSQLRNTFMQMMEGSSEAPSGEPGAGGAPQGNKEGGALEQYCVDLTAKAKSGAIDPVFGREMEIRQMVDIFARRRKNNPILVGEPGTGKTAIVEGLALRIAEGDVPPTLKGVRLLSLDMGLLQAGAGVKGEFENRLKNVIKEVKASPMPVVLFIDEAHTLIGAGGQAGGGDAANLLKPALARGELRTVAATTWAEYKKYFEKDAALERRFQLVRCEEPTVEDTVVMLRGLMDRYEKHHKVQILDEAVHAAAALSKRYISGRFLPDKAVDLLDTACARVAISLNTRPSPLEQIDRQIAHLDTAIAVRQRNLESQLGSDTTDVATLQADREKLLAEREQVEARWKDELAAANKLREACGLIGGEAEAADAKPAAAEGAEKPAAGAGNGESKAKSDECEKTTAEISAMLADLRKLQGEEPLVFPHVDGSVVSAVVSDWTGIPIGKMVKDEIASILEIETKLRNRVVGQEVALKVVGQKLRSAKAGMGNPIQPMGVFLCVGPSGVGKTELALSVSDVLFGGERFLTVINMSEFMEKHTVSQLKGSPPGYVGYGEGGVLTEAVRQHPYSVVLLDEVEKAHPDVMNLFYQVFDKGTLADGEGRVIDFRNTVIFLTSNLGTDAIQGLCESGEEVTTEALKEAIYPHLREHFKPALLARMTVIPFLTLSQEVLTNIARMKLGKLADRITKTHKIAFEADDAVYANMASRCQQVDLGARQVDHVIDQAILPGLSRELLQRMTAETMPASLRMGVTDEGEFTYTFA